MSDSNAAPPRDGWFDAGAKNIQLVYLLYLAGFVLGITPLIGVIIAYMNRGQAGDWERTHYTWAIRTFWIGLLYSVIGALLTIVLVGILVLLAVVVWYVVRCIIGLQAASRGEPIRNPRSWMI